MGRLLRHRAQFLVVTVSVQGAQVTATGRRDWNGRCKLRFSRIDRSDSSETVGSTSMRPPAARKQLPVGVGLDDLEAASSREPVKGAKTARNGQYHAEYHTCSLYTAIHYLLTESRAGSAAGAAPAFPAASGHAGFRG